MVLNCKLFSFLVIILILSSCKSTEDKSGVISGELKKWHRVTLTFDGPETSETDSINPFLDYRMLVTFQHHERSYAVPGFYAADGNAAETGTEAGNKWRVYFCPDEEGAWQYKVSFRKGVNIAVNEEPMAGEPSSFDGAEGNFEIGPTDKTGNDFRAKGKLRYAGGHYLQFAENKEFFLKGGADSPENFLAYEDFDGTWSGPGIGERPGDNIKVMQLHSFNPHTADWQEGDPIWRNGKGKNIIGALNYLASKGMNSVYMLTMNVMGDGDDVWPWIGRNERYRFDCSKLDQWEIVFTHMDKLGIMLHFVTQETENQTLLDSGNTHIQRKLYYRELIARYAHHLAITWNLGEENGSANLSATGQSDQQRRDMASYLKKTNPYQDMIVIHTHSFEPARYDIISPLLGYPDLDGLSIQAGNLYDTHNQTIKWLNLSEDKGKKWVVCLDEIGPAHTGVKPDSADPGHDDVRKYVLWANLMAGGGGVEWYFGYDYPDNDLGCEDWRSRDLMWDQTKYALEFFQNHLPFWKMKAMDELTTDMNDYCFALEGEIYAIYLPDGRTTQIDLSDQEGDYIVHWYNPRKGGELQSGSISRVSGGEIGEVGFPPDEVDEDWVTVLVLNI